jgi:pimeloyl-ACP methyl ester carboxylesterase
MAESMVRSAQENQSVISTGLATPGERARNEILARLPVNQRRLDLAGVSTAVLEGGEGPPMVLLHGPGEHATKWLRVIPSLVQGHRVVAPDLPGHGASVVNDGPIDAARSLAWLDALIEETCAAPPILVGQILAGAIAARFAVAHGAGIDRLVLVDALGFAPFQPAPEFGKALTEFLRAPTTDSHDALWRKCAFDLDRMCAAMGESWLWLKAYNLERAQTASLHADQQSLMEQFGFAAIPSEVLAQIAVPTALIWGRHDLATDLSIAEAASERFGWPLAIIENAADDPPMEQPEAFLRALSDRVTGSRSPA